MNTSWSWFDKQHQLRYYEFQTVLDILSFAENLPLRVMDYDELRKIDITELWYLDESQKDKKTTAQIKQDSKIFCENVKDLFSEIAKLHQVSNLSDSELDTEFQAILNKYRSNITLPPAFETIKNSVKRLSELEEKVWLNRPSNPLPVHSLFRHCEEWRWWILFWFFYEKEAIKTLAEKNSFSDNAFFIGSWGFCIQWITLNNDNKKYLLVVGPIYKEESLTLTTREFHCQYGRILKRCYKAFHTCYTKNSLTYLSHDDMIRRMVHVRLPISKNEVEKRVSSIKSILEMLQRALNENSKVEYSHNDIYAITFSLITLERIKTRMSESEHCFNTGEYTFNFAFFPCNINGMLAVKIHFTKEDDKKNNKIAITAIGDYEKVEGNKKYPLQSIDGNKNSENFIKLFNTKVEYWNEIYHVRRKSAQEIHTALLGEWLQNHYGSLDKNENENKNKRFYNYICRNILDAVRADECNLYRFNHIHQTIDLIGNVPLANLAQQAKKWNVARITEELKTELNENKEECYINLNEENKYKAFLRKLEEQPKLYVDKINQLDLEDKERSAVFRAIFNNINIFEENSDNNNPAFYIDTEFLGSIYPRSGIIVPITFQGRIYGALEIIGFRAYQFQWSHQLILTHVAHLIANYIYSQQMLFALQEITRLALQNTANVGKPTNGISDAYTPLCEQLSKIFLSECTNLWIRDEQSISIYHLKGTTHPHLFNNDSHDFNISENKQYVASYLIEKFHAAKETTLIVGRVDKEITESGFDQQKQLYVIGKDGTNNKLREIIIEQLNAKELVVFLLIDEKKNDILGFVTLLNPKFYGYSDNWQNIINLVREQLVIALRTLDSERRVRMADEAMLMHEIKQDAWTLYRYAKRAETDLRDFTSKANKVDLHQNMDGLQNYWQKSDSHQREQFIKQFINLFGSVQNLMQTWKRRLKPILTGQQKATERLAYKLSLYEVNKKIRLDTLYGESSPDFNDLPDFINLAEKCAEIKNTRQEVAKQKGCFIDISIDRRFSIKMQANMLHNFILNLLDNSVKYAKPHTAISLELFKTHHGYCLQIKNSAPALSKYEKNLDLFDLGVRTEQARQQDQSGDGLGLYIVACICDFNHIKYSYDKAKALQGIYLFEFEFPFESVKITSE